jgi:hypothetical protein
VRGLVEQAEALGAELAGARRLDGPVAQDEEHPEPPRVRREVHDVALAPLETQLPAVLAHHGLPLALGEAQLAGHVDHDPVPVRLRAAEGRGEVLLRGRLGPAGERVGNHGFTRERRGGTSSGATAQFLEAKGCPSLRRILRTPERWDRIRSLARDLGETLPDAPSASALQAFLLKRRAADPLRFPDLSLSVITLLGPGEYGVEVPGQAIDGHFGLAVKDYAHSTAPNRRYPDLVTQRLVKAALAGAPCPYTVADLGELARHCTEQEDDAAKIERQVKKSAAAMLLAPRKG